MLRLLCSLSYFMMPDLFIVCRHKWIINHVHIITSAGKGFSHVLVYETEQSFKKAGFWEFFKIFRAHARFFRFFFCTVGNFSCKQVKVILNFCLLTFSQRQQTVNLIDVKSNALILKISGRGQSTLTIHLKITDRHNTEGWLSHTNTYMSRRVLRNQHGLKGCCTKPIKRDYNSRATFTHTFTATHSHTAVYIPDIRPLLCF